MYRTQLYTAFTLAEKDAFASSGYLLANDNVSVEMSLEHRWHNLSFDSIFHPGLVSLGSVLAASRVQEVAQTTRAMSAECPGMAATTVSAGTETSRAASQSTERLEDSTGAGGKGKR